MFARAIIEHFIVPDYVDNPDLDLQASATAILTFCRPFFHSALAPRILAAEVDKAKKPPLHSQLRSLLYTAETAQFSQALFIHGDSSNLFKRRCQSLLSKSQYLSRSLLRLLTRKCRDTFFRDLITKIAPCVNLEEIDTDETNIFEIFNNAASQGFRIHLRKLEILSSLHDAVSPPGLLTQLTRRTVPREFSHGKELVGEELSRFCICKK